jgi:hypothetical protein
MKYQKDIKTTSFYSKCTTIRLSKLDPINPLRRSRILCIVHPNRHPKRCSNAQDQIHLTQMRESFTIQGDYLYTLAQQHD